MIQRNRKTACTNGSHLADDGVSIPIDKVNAGMNGLASVIVPIIRTLHRAPV